MMPRKKRIAIIILAVTIIILTILGIFAYLYYLTDTFKSSEELFAKYFIQNFEEVQKFTHSELSSQIKLDLEQNKYISELNAKINYTQNLNTTSENNDSTVNDTYLTIEGQTDKTNNYYYKNIKLVKDEEDLVGLEYIKENTDNYVRYLRTKQFLKLKPEESKNIEKVLDRTQLEQLKINGNELETIKNTYLGIIQENLTKDHYGKQEKVLITVNAQTITANSYYLKMTEEEYHNLKIKILETLKQDEIIKNKLNELSINLGTDEDLTQNFIQQIDKTIEEIKNEQIGTGEIKIVVYQSNKKIVRTTIETNKNKYIIDFNDSNQINVEIIEKENDNNKIAVEISKDINVDNIEELKIIYKNISNNVIINNINVNIKQEKKNINILRDLSIEMTNKTNYAKIDVLENIKIVEKFEEEKKTEMENNVIDLNSINSQQLELIQNLISTDFQQKIQEINLVDYISMFQNIFATKEEINIVDDETISETEKNRFNSNFEFFIGNGLSCDNIVDLMGYVKNNLNSIKIMKSEEDELIDFNYSEIENKDKEEISTYIKNIDKFVINIEKNEKNVELSNDFVKLLDNMKDKKFDIDVEYGDDRLVNKINIKVQNKE